MEDRNGVMHDQENTCPAGDIKDGSGSGKIDVYKGFNSPGIKDASSALK